MGENQKAALEPVPFEEALDVAGNGIYNVLLVATTSLTLMALGMDLFGFSMVVVSACDLDLSVTQKSILNSLPYLGILLVSYPWGYISDTRGRQFTLRVSMLGLFILSCLGSFSPNWILLAIFKFFAVCFGCAANSAAYTLVGESCVQRVRSKHMLLMTSLLIFSPAIASAITYPILHLDIATYIPVLGITFRPWRLLMIILTIPSGICGFAIMFFHESPKFLTNVDRQDEALEVLRSIYAMNNKKPKEEYQIQSITLSFQPMKRYKSVFKNIYEQSAPLFRPPILKQTLQLFYIVFVTYITNNSFLVWLPELFNLVRISLAHNGTGNICDLIELKKEIDAANKNVTPVCTGTIANYVIFTLMASQSTFALLNFVISYFPTHRKGIMIGVFCMSATGGVLLNWMPEPISSVLLFVVFTGTCLNMGIVASYNVDLYQTSYRGMIACLSIMVGRSSTCIGINVVGHILFTHCHLTFYFWAVLVLSAVVPAYFLARDKLRPDRTAL